MLGNAVGRGAVVMLPDSAASRGTVALANAFCFVFVFFFSSTSSRKKNRETE
jgi:hypothetical protein